MVVLSNVKDNEKFLFAKERERTGLELGRWGVGRLWEKLGEGNDQNIMYKKKAYFNTY